MDYRATIGYNFHKIKKKERMLMKKVMKIVGIVVLIVIVMLAAAFGFYWYKNMHWYDKYEKALKEVRAEEKQVTLPDGSILSEKLLLGETVYEECHARYRRLCGKVSSEASG